MTNGIYGASPRIQIPGAVYASDLLIIYFNVLGDDDDVHDGSVKDKDDHNQDGAHDIADADNNNEAAADPHLTVEDFLLECKWGRGWWVQGAMR